MSRSHGRAFWLEHAAQGLVLGAGIATLDFLYYFPMLSASNDIGPGAFGASLAVWCGECVLFALALGAAQRLVSPGELVPWRLGIAVVAAAGAGVFTWQAFAVLVLRDQLGLRLFRDHVGQSGPWMGAVLYHVWLLLFFGGLMAAVMASQRWRERMLSQLRAAELSRATSQQRLATARLASLEARVDPGHLFDTLSRLERLYEDDPPAADRLLDELIAFLRNALAGAQAGPSITETE